uniref:Uncharacterized protein At1g27050 n=1 Tax=Nicotiana tabacum TaxID=4097 RepID=A0A1S4CQ48_TOBAC|nr:PREDICTED: uncharacterized protein At1g27050 [Nicotiana tabacum]
MGRKRDRTHFNRHVPYSFPKRRRPPPTDAVSDDPLPSNNSSSTTKQQPGNVVVVGVPTDCSVLDLKSRFEIYGSISRTRMDPNGLAYITFRSYDSAQSAVNAAVDSSFPITLHSKPVQVIWATDHVPQWKEGAMRKDDLSSSTVASKLVRAEVPLSRHGRGNRLGSAIVNPKDEDNDIAGNNGRGHVSTRLVEPDNAGDNGRGHVSTRLVEPYKGREIVAYDDIL